MKNKMMRKKGSKNKKERKKEGIERKKIRERNKGNLFSGSCFLSTIKGENLASNGETLLLLLNQYEFGRLTDTFVYIHTQ